MGWKLGRHHLEDIIILPTNGNLNSEFQTIVSKPNKTHQLLASIHYVLSKDSRDLKIELKSGPVGKTDP